MKIAEMIETVKKHSKGYGVIDDAACRDQILYGSADRECTGIAVCIYPSVDVIREALEIGANLIICHESCFWNRGDHTDWLIHDKTYQKKAALLREGDITVWRDHDYIHSGILYEGRFVDGIFFGLTEELGWRDYLADDQTGYGLYEIPQTPTRKLAQEIMEKLDLDGMKTMADIDGYSHRIMIPGHIMGHKDNDLIRTIEEKNIDTLLAMEIVDFTAAIYMRDSAQLSRNRSILIPGHFNLEEPGMKWFANNYLPPLLPEVPITFVKAGDSYRMLTRGTDLSHERFTAHDK